MELTSRQLLSNKGTLATIIENFVEREVQMIMAEKIEYSLANEHILICEAGTGIGKTFAYLIPALQSGKKIVISTGTKHLQDQLFTKDLPILLEALGKACKVALLKGRANYICRYRLNKFATEGHFVSLKVVHDLQKVPHSPPF